MYGSYRLNSSFDLFLSQFSNEISKRSYVLCTWHLSKSFNLRRPDPEQREKIILDFYVHTLLCLKRFHRPS